MITIPPELLEKIAQWQQRISEEEEIFYAARMGWNCRHEMPADYPFWYARWYDNEDNIIDVKFKEENDNESKMPGLLGDGED